MKNINIPNFIMIDNYMILTYITKYDTTDDFYVPDNLVDRILEYYKMIEDLFKVYSRFDIHVFTKAFSYNLYLEACNFNTDEIDYDNICLSSIAYNILKYLKKSWEIKKEDLKKIPYFHSYYKNNRKTRLTRNYIYKYYTNKILKAVNDDNITSRHYYDNEILGLLIYYDNLENKYDEF